MWRKKRNGVGVSLPQKRQQHFNRFQQGFSGIMIFTLKLNGKKAMLSFDEVYLLKLNYIFNKPKGTDVAHRKLLSVIKTDSLFLWAFEYL